MTEFHKIHLMDAVTYKGQRCFVNNGTKSDSNGNRLWDILPEEFDENGKRSPRDDTGNIIKEYRDKGIFEDDPFASLDQTGIGKLVQMAVELGKKTRPSIHLGICGEHGGDPKSIDFCHRVGLQYVSCSPFRVPIARGAAAEAAIRNK